MSLVRLKIKGISYSSNQNGAYALILNEVDGDRRLPIVIGAFEAQSIAIALEKDISPPRPLTHDLFKNFCDHFAINIKQVVIHRLVEGVFISSIIAERDAEEVVIDARTSDAVALAMRFDAPIFTYKSILDQAGVYLTRTQKDKEEEENKESILVDEILQEEETVQLKGDEGITGYKKMSLEDLYKALEKAVTDENYERAAKIRDEISKRKT